MDGNPGPVQTPPPQAPPADQPTPEQPAGEAPSPQTKWFPSAFTVIAIVLFGVWLLTNRLHTIKPVLVATLADEAENGGPR